MERVPSGIPGLDEMIEGGFPEGDSILVTGPPGSAKSTFALQFLVKGILERNERALYIEVGEKLEKMIEHVQRFGWDLRKLQSEGKLLMLPPSLKPEEGDDPMEWLNRKEIKTAISEFRPHRVVVDSLSLLMNYAREHGGYRRSIQRLIASFNLGSTTLFISEVSRVYDDRRLDYSPEEFIVDGIINLYYQRESGSFERSLAILKMRGTNHSRKITRFEVEDGNGLMVRNEALGAVEWTSRD